MTDGLKGCPSVFTRFPASKSPEETDVKAPEVPGPSPVEPKVERPENVRPPDPVELALSDALTRASVAGQWEVVSQLARELEARRRAREGATNVVHLDDAKARRGG